MHLCSPGPLRHSGLPGNVRNRFSARAVPPVFLSFRQKFRPEAATIGPPGVTSLEALKGLCLKLSGEKELPPASPTFCLATLHSNPNLSEIECVSGARVVSNSSSIAVTVILLASLATVALA